MPTISTRSTSKLTMVEQLMGSVAVRQLDIDATRALCEKCGIPVAGQGNDAILGIAHRIRLGIPEATPAEKRASEEWLRFRNLM